MSRLPESAYLPCEHCGGRVDDVDACVWCGGSGESHDVACPNCSARTPDVFLCRHDANPICDGCCLREHDNSCPDCNGAGTFIVQHAGEFGHHDAVCAFCEGSGRVNQGKP